MRFLLPLLLLLFWLPQVEAAYSNPLLKVLLLKTEGNVTLKSASGIEFYGLPNPLTPPKRLTLNYLGRSQVQVGEFAVTEAPFFLVSQKPINLNGRLYEGELEIRPYPGGFRIINHIKTEDYLEGVLNGEISTKWNQEVVMAQAILARTYALKKRDQNRSKPWHLVAGYHDQVYQGVGVSDEAGRHALGLTRGYVVHYDNRLAEVYYHSNCGGHTEDPSNIWAYGLPYYQIKEVPFGHEDPNYYWTLELNPEQVSKILRKLGHPEGQGFEVAERNDSGRVQSLLILGSDAQVSAKDFRTAIGFTSLKSLLFELSPHESGLTINGQGNGHGIGMCQWAAKEMADVGYKYYEILYYFYDGIEIEQYPN